ncbi:MAG TPA: exonuclease domain-containing protein [Gemmatimonadaceae bacterium]|nr:exonuclease domain-containing protein [Gemmatimonadaceae bacterium]
MSVDALHALSYVVVDVETTGMRPFAGDRITEFAAVVVRNGVIAERYETLVNPGRPIPPFISALTHITWSMVRTAPTFGDICADVMRIMRGHVFVAHNVAFDWRFVSAEVARATGEQLDARQLCTVRLARRVLPSLPSRRLDALARHYSIAIPGRHRAGGDALATAAILLRLLDAARERDCRCWGDLQQLLRTRRPRRRVTGLPQPFTPERGI